jgi:hypothetical protein
VIVRPAAFPTPAWPAGWEDVEVVAGEVVEPAPRRPLGPSAAPGGVYDRSGRMAPAERCGRLISVLA